MTDQTHSHEPMRNHDGDVIYTSLKERPRPEFHLDPLHKALLTVSVILAIIVPIVFALQTVGMTELLPVRYGVDGEVLREGSVWEALGGLTLLALGILGVAILARYPRIYNYPFMLTEHNAQRQYKNAVQMLAWVAFSMSLIMIVMVASWLEVLAMGWIWVALGVTVAAAIFFIWRMIKLR